MLSKKNIFYWIHITIFTVITASAIEPSLEDKQLRHQIGQLLIVGIPGTNIEAASPIAIQLHSLNVGGVILFAKNITGKEQLKNLTTQLQKAANTPLFIAVDAEGGKVNRLKPELGFWPIPSAAEMGKGSVEQTFKISSMIAEQLAHVGCNVNFAPVVDLNINPENPVIGKFCRSFSDKPEDVVNHAKAFIAAHKKHNIITAPKHFPGHGSSTTDSHMELTDVTLTYKPEELIPYQQLISAGFVDMVMTAHIINLNIDKEYPATLSPNFITKVLREINKFDGVVVSDDLCMRAIHNYFSFENALITAINAGCDLLIISGNTGNIMAEQTAWLETQTQACEIIFTAVKQGKITKERIFNAFNHIQILKGKYGIIG